MQSIMPRWLEPEVKDAVEEEVSFMPIDSERKAVRWSGSAGGARVAMRGDPPRKRTGGVEPASC